MLLRNFINLIKMSMIRSTDSYINDTIGIKFPNGKTTKYFNIQNHSTGFVGYTLGNKASNTYNNTVVGTNNTDNPSDWGPSTNYTLNQNPTATLSLFCICIGSGNTPPTLDDYKLEEPITLNHTSTSSITNSDGQKVTFSVSFTNTDTENIRVNEVGLYKMTQGDASRLYYALYIREVLPETVIIAPGDTKTFTIILDFFNLENQIQNT